MTGLNILPLLLLLAQPLPAEPAAEAGESLRIDRGLQLIVYPDRVRLQYDLGLSPATAISLLGQKSAGAPDAEQSLETEDRRALMEAFRDVVLPDIQRRCRIIANQQPLPWRSLESLIFPKHYVQLSCIYEADLPTSGQTVELQLIDGSFRSCQGDHVIALKAEDGVQLQSSTVPLILARVPRHSLGINSAAEREAARRAEAVVVRQGVALAEAPGAPATASPVKPAVTPQPASAGSDRNPQAKHRQMILFWAVACGLGVLIVVLASLARR